MRKVRHYVSLVFMLLTAAATIQQLMRPPDERTWQG
jgi:hypothetical protein